MKAADFEKFIKEYSKKLTNCSKEQKAKVHVLPRFFIKKWEKGGYSRTYLNVTFDIIVWTCQNEHEDDTEQKQIYIECGFINNKTARYSHKNKTDFRSDDAFEEVERTVAELKATVAPELFSMPIEEPITVEEPEIVEPEILFHAVANNMELKIIKRDNKFSPAITVDGKTHVKRYCLTDWEALLSLYDYCEEKGIKCQELINILKEEGFEDC